MNEKWLKQQAEEISMALARSGIRWAMPVDDAVRGQKVFVTDSTNVAAYIDHTLLAPTASREQIGRLCQEALEYRFASVCVNPGHVRLAARLLAGSPVKTCTVIGFPLGATTTLSKVMEARDAVANGAQELDMVINVGGTDGKGLHPGFIRYSGSAGCCARLSVKGDLGNGLPQQRTDSARLHFSENGRGRFR